MTDKNTEEEILFGEHLTLINYDTKKYYDLNKIMATEDDLPILSTFSLDPNRKDFLLYLSTILIENRNCQIKLIVDNSPAAEELDNLMDEGFESVDVKIP